MNNSFIQLAPHSRVWIFQSDRFLNENEKGFIEKIMGEFIPQWASHGNDLYGGFSIEKNLFLVIGVDEAKSPASGCSIDSLTRVVQNLGREMKIDFFNRMAISYENEAGKIELTDMTTFKQFIKSNQINENTIVYNNLVNTKADFDNNWRTAVKNSWHTNLFEIA